MVISITIPLKMSILIIVYMYLMHVICDMLINQKKLGDLTLGPFWLLI